MVIPLDCKKGVLITSHHNKLHDGVIDLSGKAFTSHTCMTTPKYTKVTPCRVGGGGGRIKFSPPKEEEELKGGILIRDFWAQGTGSIHYVFFTTCQKSPRSALRPLGRIRIGSTPRPASNSVFTSLPSSPQCTAFSGSRQRQHLNVFPSALQKSGRNPTHVSVGT